MFNEYDLSFPDSDMNEYVSWKDKVRKGEKWVGSGQKASVYLTVRLAVRVDPPPPYPPSLYGQVL